MAAKNTNSENHIPTAGTMTEVKSSAAGIHRIHPAILGHKCGGQ